MDELSAESLLKELRAVDAERARRAADPELEARVQSLKTFQQRRFAASYADLEPALLGRVEELIDFVTAPGTSDPAGAFEDRKPAEKP
jgi:hypothetical protein